MEDFIKTIMDTTIDHEKRLLQIQQILVLLIRDKAVDMTKLTEGQRDCINRFVLEWLEEWAKTRAKEEK